MFPGCSSADKRNNERGLLLLGDRDDRGNLMANALPDLDAEPLAVANSDNELAAKPTLRERAVIYAGRKDSLRQKLQKT